MKNCQGPSKSDMKNFKARRSTVFKKAAELSTLCGVDVALVMYHPHSSIPDLWCSRPDSISSILSNILPDSSPPKPTPSLVIDSLAIDDLSNFHGFLSTKLDKVNHMINTMRGINSEGSHSDDNTVLMDDDFAYVDFVLDNSNIDFGHLVDQIGLINDEIADGSFSLDDFDDQGLKFNPQEFLVDDNDEFRWFKDSVNVNEYDQASTTC